MGNIRPQQPHGGYTSHPDPKTPTDPIEIQFANFPDGWIKDKFLDMERIVHTVKDITVILNSTNIVMTNSVRTVEGVTNIIDQLRSTFNYIYKSMRLFSLFRWLYVKFLKLLGCKVPLDLEDDATEMVSTTATTNTEVVSHRVLVFLGVLFSAPYLISNFLILNLEEAMHPMDWRSSGYLVKVIKDFDGRNENEMSLRVNDKLVVAPRYIQSEMNLDNTEFVYASGNGGSGLVPLKHLMIELPE